jgi:hypothetical protein
LYASSIRLVSSQCFNISFFLLVLPNLFVYLHMFYSEEQREPNTEVPPQSPLALPIARVESPLPDDGDSTKKITEKKTHKVVAKKKRQGQVQPSVTIGRPTPGPLAEDVIFLMSVRRCL